MNSLVDEDDVVWWLQMSLRVSLIFVRYWREERETPTQEREREEGEVHSYDDVCGI